MGLNNFLKNSSIKNKLIAIILLVVVAAMIFMMSFTMIEKISNAKTNLANNTILNAHIVGEYCVPALYFHRPDAANDALKKLETIAYILNGIVYDNNDSMFAEYSKEIFNENLAKKYSNVKQNRFFEDDYLVVAIPLSYHGEKLGVLYLRSTLEFLNEEINDFVLFNIILFLVILSASYFFASKLQEVVSEPILHLAEVTKEITKNKDFNVRVKKQGRDEIGSLYDEFNYMLDRIKISSEERDKALNTLKISEERLKLALEGANDGLWDWDLISGEVYFSPRWLNMLGYEPGEIEGSIEAWKSLVHPEDLNAAIELLNEHLKGESDKYRSEFRMKTKQGTWKWIMGRGKVVQRDENGNPLRMVGTHTNISARKKVEEELLLAKEKAEKSDKFKSEFLAQMSHEIRSPINVILSFASLLKEEIKSKLDSDLANSFDHIDSGGRRIIRTIDMILNMSEIQTGIVEINPVVMNVAEKILNRLVLEYRTQARIKGLELNFNSDLDNNHLVKVDEYSVTQIFSNLIDNAIKYTRKGKIDVYTYAKNGSVFVEVTDTGIGIAQEYIPVLFDAFTQEETGYSRKFEGNGLGLALVKKYCELNNAVINVKSIKGEGTKFTVTFTSCF